MNMIRKGQIEGIVRSDVTAQWNFLTPIIGIAA